MFFAGFPWPGGPYTSLDSAAASDVFFYDVPTAVLFTDRQVASGELEKVGGLTQTYSMPFVAFSFLLTQRSC